MCVCVDAIVTSLPLLIKGFAIACGWLYIRWGQRYLVETIAVDTLIRWIKRARNTLYVVFAPVLIFLTILDI